MFPHRVFFHKKIDAKRLATKISFKSGDLNGDLWSKIERPILSNLNPVFSTCSSVQIIYIKHTISAKKWRKWTETGLFFIVETFLLDPSF